MSNQKPLLLLRFYLRQGKYFTAIDSVTYNGGGSTIFIPVVPSPPTSLTSDDGFSM